MHTKCMGPDDMITSLSGGNQQKVIFGKWLEREPQVFMMDEPTRGIDVGAKYEIYELIIKMAKQGKTVIVVSSEMPEILGITNRIGVMSNGHLSGIVNTKETNQEELFETQRKIPVMGDNDLWQLQHKLQKFFRRSRKPSFASQSMNMLGKSRRRSMNFVLTVLKKLSISRMSWIT